MDANTQFFPQSALPPEFCKRGRPAGWRAVFLGVCLALTTAANAADSGPAASAAPTAPTAARQKALVHLVRQDCGSCHGLTLQGGLGSPLTAQAMAEKPVDSMVATILNGRPGTPMPPWKTLLSETEAIWIVEQLQRGFPKE